MWDALSIVISSLTSTEDLDLLKKSYGLSKVSYEKLHNIKSVSDKSIEIINEGGSIRTLPFDQYKGKFKRYEALIEISNNLEDSIVEYFRLSEDKAKSVAQNNSKISPSSTSLIDTVAQIIFKDDDYIRNSTDAIEFVKNNLKIPYYLIKKEEFIENMPNEYQLNPFERSFTNWFVEYKNKSRDNALKQLDAKDNLATNHLSDGEFEEKFGQKPWEQMDTILSELSINLRFTPPRTDELDSYVAKLTDPDRKYNIDSTNVSSGEKVILSLISSAQYSAQYDVPLVLPKIILLDEPDAHLHPRFSSVLIAMLRKLTTDYKNLHIVVVTHSPSTIALANDDEVFFLRSHGTSKFIEKHDLDTVLSILTHGLPTLNISTTNARQVYVEGKSDKRVFDAIYDKYIYDCMSDGQRSPKVNLFFMYHGMKEDDSDGGISGWSVVNNQVSILRESKIDTVYGVIDYDLDDKRKHNKYVYIFGDKSGYSLENFVLHPLIVIMYFLKINRKIDLSFLGIDEFCRSDQLSDASFFACSNLFDEISMRFCAEVLESIDTDDTVDTKLAGFDCPIKVARSYRNYRGHDLSAAIVKRFPEVKTDLRGSSDLMGNIASFVLQKNPELIPQEFIDFFNRIE